MVNHKRDYSLNVSLRQVYLLGEVNSFPLAQSRTTPLWKLNV
jgi:hypothetical protein